MIVEDVAASSRERRSSDLLFAEENSDQKKDNNIISPQQKVDSISKDASIVNNITNNYICNSKNNLNLIYVKKDDKKPAAEALDQVSFEE